MAQASWLYSALLAAAAALGLTVLFLRCFPVLRVPTRRPGPGERVDVVVAAYREDLGWLQVFEPGGIAGDAVELFVYSKHPDTAVVDGRPSRVLPNVGRCDHTYLHHIVTNYEHLADTTLFLTGTARALWWKWLPLRLLLVPRLGAPDGIVSGAVRPFRRADRRLRVDRYRASGSEAEGDGSVEPARIRPFAAWWRAHFPDRPEPSHVAVGGVFAARRSAIRRVPLGVWRSLLEEHAVADNVEVGHYMERSWYALLHS